MLKTHQAIHCQYVPNCGLTDVFCVTQYSTHSYSHYNSCVTHKTLSCKSKLCQPGSQIHSQISLTIWKAESIQSDTERKTAVFMESSVSCLLPRKHNVHRQTGQSDVGLTIALTDLETRTDIYPIQSSSRQSEIDKWNHWSRTDVNQNECF